MKLIPKNELENLYRKYWYMDKDGIISVHISGADNIDDCIKRTLKDLELVDNLVVYELDNDYGFFGYETKEYLPIIFVNPKNRNKSDMKYIVECINNTMSDPFYFGLYSKNKKAINFVLKNGGKIVFEGLTNRKEHATILKVTGGLKCH